MEGFVYRGKGAYDVLLFGSYVDNGLWRFLLLGLYVKLRALIGEIEKRAVVFVEVGQVMAS